MQIDANAKSIKQTEGDINTQSNLNPNLETDTDVINITDLNA